MVKKRFRSSVNINRTRSCPGADVGSDHELLMITFPLRLKRIIKPTNTRIKYDLEKLKDPSGKSFPDKDRWEICTTHSTRKWEQWHIHYDHSNEHSSNRNSQRDPCKTPSDKEAMGYFRHPRSVRQEKRTKEKERWHRMERKIQKGEHWDQKHLEKSEREMDRKATPRWRIRLSKNWLTPNKDVSPSYKTKQGSASQKNTRC